MRLERTAGGLVAVALLGAALLLPAGASAQERPAHWAGQSLFRASIGWFSPDGESSYWRDKEIDFTGETGEFDDLTLGLDYAYFVSPRVALLLSMGGWEGQQTQSYRDFVDPLGREIAHLSTTGQLCCDVGAVYRFLSRRAALMPYVGAGGGLVSWRLREEG